jgi:hypothetical protein
LCTFDHSNRNIYRSGKDSSSNIIQGNWEDYIKREVDWGLKDCGSRKDNYSW